MFCAVRNIKDITPHYLGTKLGYDVFIPDFMYNPISYNKSGCPIWVKTNDNGDCYVFLQECDWNLENEITDFILNNLPKKKSLYCCGLSVPLQNKIGVSDTDEFGLNSACVDENGEIHAYVIIGNGEIEGNNVMMITHVWYSDEKSLSMLRDYLLRDENDEKYRPKELWHSITDKTVVDTLHFIDRGNGVYSWQFE